jgi:ketosteroid isomerase-like protein
VPGVTPAETEALARRFLEAYAAKDLPPIAGMVAEEALLRDWNLEVRGRAAFLAETQRNFDNAACIAIDVLHLHATAQSVAAEVLITVDGNIRLRVVDVFDLDASGQVTAVRSYKGLDPDDPEVTRSSA